MSNYQARKRATRAERAADRCAELCEEMRQECRRHERMHYEETKRQFDLEHAYLIAQMNSVQDALATQCRLQSSFFVTEKNVGLTSSRDVQDTATTEGKT